MSKTAMIFGVTGQDGSYLTDLLLEKNYDVVGVVRRSSSSNTSRIDGHSNNRNLTLVEGDVSDSFSVSQLIEKYHPDEVYNLAAQSHVKTSFDQPIYTWRTNAEGPVYILEAIRKYSPDTKFYQASTSEMFGKSYNSRKSNVWGDPVVEKFQNENTSLMPQSPYAIAKLAAHHSVRLYRQSYDIYACSGILFNHDSEIRGELFVTRKITKWISSFVEWVMTQGLDFDVKHYRFDRDGFYSNREDFSKLRLGNLDAKRDWGHAKDYVYGMWLMLQQEEPDDYVLATGETHTVGEFLDVAFSHIGIDDWEPFITIDPEFYRPSEVDYLLGDPSKANKKLGWSCEIGFEKLVKNMVDSDLGKFSELLRSPLF